MHLPAKQFSIKITGKPGSQNCSLRQNRFVSKKIQAGRVYKHRNIIWDLIKKRLTKSLMISETLYPVLKRTVHIAMIKKAYFEGE